MDTTELKRITRMVSAALITLGILLLLAGIGIAIIRNQWERSNELLSRTIKTNTIQEQWRNQLGQQITLANSNYLTTKELFNSQDSSITALREDLGKMAKDLQTVTYLYTSLRQEIRTGVRDTTVLVDGRQLPARTFSYRDDWTPRLRGMLLGDSLWLDYEVKMDWRLTQHWGKRSLLGLGRPRELNLEVLSLNPHVSVNRVQQFHIVQPKPMIPPWVLPSGTFLAGFLLGAAR